ncbi:MAG: ABC transporter permease [Eubacterium sp.]|nr:ABC transporter permease [Eubacterium sp.]
MKTIHMHKLGAVMEMKLRALLSKNFIVMPLFAVGFTFIMKLAYGSFSENGLDDMLRGMAMANGALINISGIGVYCVSAALAEEKEKHTLRVLMTSSVNGLEFFLGSLLPFVGMMMAVNVVIAVVAEVAMTGVQWAAYLGVSLLSAVTSAVIGMIFGIFSKNQVTASTVTTPALLVFMMLPMFANLNDLMGTVSGFLFTGVMQQTVMNIVTKQEHLTDGLSIAVMTAEIVAAVVCFLVIYRKNGYDSD